MKPETLAQLIVDNPDGFIDGYKTSADNEKGAQIALDKILKTRWGVSQEHVDFGGVKIRENAYPLTSRSTKTSDFSFKVNKTENSGPVDFRNPKTYQLKQTAYVIEVKSESGATHNFSSMSWGQALSSDIDKLKSAANDILYIGFAQESQNMPRMTSRCFAVLLSFDPDTSAKIKAGYAGKFPGAALRSASNGHYDFVALVQEVKAG